MANLLARDRASEPFAPLSAPALERLRERVRGIGGRSLDVLRAADAELRERLEGELEELDDVPSLALVEALVAEADATRADAPYAPGPVGWLLYRPARSLATGEAEIASRGFFDVADRPPLPLWVGATARKTAGSGIDIGVIVALPASVLAAAEAGRTACPNGALVAVDAVAPALATQLVSLSPASRHDGSGERAG